MKAICPFERSVTVYQSPERNIAEVLALHQHRCDNLFLTFNAALNAQPAQLHVGDDSGLRNV